MTKVVKFPTASVKPRTFTSNEEFIDALAEEIITSRRTYKSIALECKLSTSTVQNLASRTTRWPRHTTLFPLAMALGLKIGWFK